MASIRKEIHNGSAQFMLAPDRQTKVVWIADFLPDAAAAAIGTMMGDGMRAMKQAFDRLADRS